VELGTQNPVRSFFQRVDARVGRGREIAAVLMAICDHHCAASRIARGSNILPAVAYEKALRQIDAPILGGLQQQARLGFTTLTLVGIVVEADANIVERQRLADGVADFFNNVAIESAARHIRLIG